MTRKSYTPQIFVSYFVLHVPQQLTFITLQNTLCINLFFGLVASWCRDLRGLFIIPPTQRSCSGVYWFHSVRSSVRPCWELLPDRNRISMGLWYWKLMSRPDPEVLPVGTLHSLEWFWVSRRIFIYSHHNTFVFSLRRPFVHGLFVSWGATGWPFVINSRANIYVTIDCSTVLPLVLGVVTRQKPHITGSVVLGADELMSFIMSVEDSNPLMPYYHQIYTCIQIMWTPAVQRYPAASQP